MLRIAVQAKGRLYDETMSFLEESDIKLNATKRTLLVQSSNFPLEVLFLRDDDIPQSVATGVADIGIVGENEFMEKSEDAEIVKRLGFSKCRLSLAVPKEVDYPGVEWFNGRKIATSYPGILSAYLKKMGVRAEIHVITGSVEVSPGIGLADAIFDIVSSGSTLVSNSLKEVEVVMKSEALLIGNKRLSEEKRDSARTAFPYGCRKDSRRQEIRPDECPEGQVGADCFRFAGHEEPHGDALGAGRLVFGTHRAG